MTFDIAPVLLAQGEPAAGAPAADLIAATIVGLGLIAVLVAFGAAHRRGRTQLLTRVAGFSERVSGLPGWAALPAGITAGSLLIAVFGFYWDVATHIDSGRDAGPFANPSHYLIIIGLGGIALAGAVGLILGADRNDRAAITTRSGWRMPIGAILLLVCGGIAVMGFPLDDVWHRLFGQDVTLWSPTHMQMVGGASLSTLALWVLYLEGSRSLTPEAAARLPRWLEVGIAGAFLVGLSAFQAEFDYSVPQFRLVYHPILLMMSAGIALVPARIRLGRGGALKAVGFFILLRAALSLIIGPGMDHTTLHFPLYLAEALAVEFVAARVDTRRQVTFGALAGAAIGIFGLGAEWLWSNVWMTIPWTSALVPEGIVAGLLAGIVGGLLGGLIGRAMVEPGTVPESAPRWLAPVVAVGVLACLAYPFPTDAALDGTATLALEEVDGRAGYVRAEVTVEPSDLADDAEWFNVTAWQGGGSVVQELVPSGDGRFRAPQPIPVQGDWKALIRYQHDRTTLAAPIYLPRDEAIPAPEVPAEDGATRGFIADKEIVLREARDVDEALTYSASAVLVLIAIFWALALSWGLARLSGTTRGRATSARAVHAS